jgi:hypothetical protein
VAARRRRSPLTAASGSGQIAYHGNSHAVDTSSASVLQPAATRQSAVPTPPFRRGAPVRHRAYASSARKPATYSSRHQPGVPRRPSRRAVSAGALCEATSCCCSPTAPRKPNVCAPKPISPTTATAASAAHALSANSTRSRARGGDSTRNGSASPAVTLTPTPAASAAAAQPGRARARVSPAAARELAPPPAACPRQRPPAVSASAKASASSKRVSLCAPPTASTSSTGFRPTNATAHRDECPARAAARPINATAPALESTAIALNAHTPPARPSGTIA